MTIPKAQLQELEFIGGTNDQNDSNDDEVYTNWVSETCVRSLVLSLIGVLAAEEESSATLVRNMYCKFIFVLKYFAYVGHEKHYERYS